MMIVINLFSKKKLFNYFCAGLVILIFSCSGKTNKEGGQVKNSLPVIQTTTFPVQNGKYFGYEIVIDGKVFIHQEHIPAIEGKHYFQTEELAQRVGTAVKKKLEQNMLLYP